MTPLRLIPFKETEGNGFVLKVQPTLSGHEIEFMATNHKDETVIHTVFSRVALAMSFCQNIIDLIKRFDPTALIIVDIDVRLDR